MTYPLNGQDGKVVVEVPLSACDPLFALVVPLPHIDVADQVTPGLHVLDEGHRGVQLIVDEVRLGPLCGDVILGSQAEYAPLMVSFKDTNYMAP